jgi:polar amino acid transport system substrate-binding protein
LILLAFAQKTSTLHAIHRTCSTKVITNMHCSLTTSHWLRILNLLCLLLISTFCLADDKLSFGVDAPASPPYLYLAENSFEYQGVIPDVLNKLKKLHSFKIRYIDSFRKRTESFLYSGEIDGFLSSVDWLEHPELLIHSLHIVEHRSYLYSNQPFANGFKLEDLSGVDVCARSGYLYPALTSYFTSGKLHRIDSTNQLSMLNMVKINRCRMAVMHEFNAIAILSSAEFIGHKIYQSPFTTDAVALSIFLRPELIEVKQLLDEIIVNMKKSGELDESLRHHLDVAM